MAGMFVAILNQTLINVALPIMINDFSISTATAQWLTTGFMLVNGILVPVSAYLIQKFTYRQLFLFAMISFTIGSVICAISTNFPLMMTGRVIQAVGAGILMPLGTNVFMTVFPRKTWGCNGDDGNCLHFSTGYWSDFNWMGHSELPLERHVLRYDSCWYHFYYYRNVLV